MGRNTGLLLNQGLHGVATCGGQALHVFYVKAFGACRLPSLLGDDNLAQGGHRWQNDFYPLLSARVAEQALARIVANHRELNDYAVCRSQRYAELAL